MAGPDRRDLGQVFNEVPELYDRVRPAYPDELFADLVAISPARDTRLQMRWSRWRRRHQHRSRTSRYQRQRACDE